MGTPVQTRDCLHNRDSGYPMDPKGRFNFWGSSMLKKNLPRWTFSKCSTRATPQCWEVQSSWFPQLLTPMSWRAGLPPSAASVRMRLREETPEKLVRSWFHLACTKCCSRKLSQPFRNKLSLTFSDDKTFVEIRMSHELEMLIFTISVQKLCCKIKCLYLGSLNSHLKVSLHFQISCILGSTLWYITLLTLTLLAT